MLFLSCICCLIKGPDGASSFAFSIGIADNRDLVENGKLLFKPCHIKIIQTLTCSLMIIVASLVLDINP